MARIKILAFFCIALFFALGNSLETKAPKGRKGKSKGMKGGKSSPVPNPSATPAPTPEPTPKPLETDSPTGTPTEPPENPITDSPTGTPTEPLPPTPAPSPAPSPAPTPSPTPAPTPATTNQTPAPTSVPIREIVRPVALQGGDEWDDAESYAAKAITWLETDPLANSGSLSDVKIQQRYALASIYYSTYAVQNKFTVVEPPGWIFSTNWITEADECTWYGLTCNDGLVEVIDLFNNRITGTFPAETKIMASSVTRIDLLRNPVYNTGDEGNAWLGEMVNLRYLYYGETYFEYEGIPPQIANLTNLIEYDCSFTKYSGPLDGATFAPLQRLEYLELSENNYNSPIPVEIGQLPRLQFLYVQNASVAGDLSFMEPMQAIVECWVDENPGLGGAIPANIGNLQTLQSWSITGCGFTGPIPAQIGDLQNMMQMWFYDNMLIGAVPPEIGNLKRLRIFEMEENLITGTMPSEICVNRDPPVGSGLLQTLEADCGGTQPEIECECCTCCEQCLDF